MNETFKQAWKTAEELYPEMLQTLETITGFERGSGTGDLTGLRQTATFLQDKLKKMGCETTIHEDEIWGPTLVGIKKGRGRARVLMFAHMDTVWPVGSCSNRPFRIEGSRAYGPGTSDCSHGILCQIYALKTLERMGIDDYGELILLFNPDEEHCSPSSTKWIQHYARRADVAFCMEGSDGTDLYISSRGGSVYYELKVKGVQAHAGVNPQDGRNAITELVYKLNALATLQVPDSYFSISYINGGVGGCVIPKDAYAMFRYRVDSGEVERIIDENVRRICETTYIDGTSSVLTRLPIGFGPLERTEDMDRFCKLIDETSAQMGYPLRESFCGGGADAVTAQRAGAPTIDGMTPVSYGCHTEEEFLDLDTVVPRIAIMAMVLMRISRDEQYLRDVDDRS